MTRPVVVLVDVYGANGRLAQAFAEAGCAPVRVRSSADVPPGFAHLPDPPCLAADLVHTGDLEVTLKAVRELAPVAVLAGSEPGVELADVLASRLGLPGNGTDRSAARRDKYVMVETLRAADVRAARQRHITCAQDLGRFHAEVEGPMVVKPLRSAGNDHVAFCATVTEAAAAFEALMGQLNLMGEVNEAAVAQELLIGTEYVVNTVSCRGRHRLTDSWQYTKIDVNGVSNRVSAAVSVPPDAPELRQLEDYAFSVLDTLGIEYGPAHLEVMLTPDGPCLVEMGARMSGADTARFALRAGGQSQVEWTVDAYLRPDRFLARHREPSTARNSVAMCFLTSPATGTLRSYPLMDAVRRLESFDDVVLAVQPGDWLPLTVDDASEPALVSLVHPIRDVLWRDLLTMHYLDGHGFYDLQPVRATSSDLS